LGRRGDLTKKTFTIRRNKDGTVTFRTKTFVEHFDGRDKGMLETYEYIKTLAVTAGISLNQETLEELLRDVRGLND
jgi:hypothetical protein